MQYLFQLRNLAQVPEGFPTYNANPSVVLLPKNHTK